MHKNTLLTIVLVAGLLVSGVPVAAQLTAGGGTTYETDRGPAVTVPDDHGIDTSNPFDADGETVTVDGATVSAPGSGALAYDDRSPEGSVSQLDAADTTITFDSGGPELTAAGELDSIDWQEPALDGNTTMSVSASGAGTITIDGLDDRVGEDYAARKDDGTILNSGSVDGTGTVEIEAAAGSYDVELFEPEPAEIVAANPPDNAAIDEATVELNATVEVDSPADVVFTVEGDGEDTINVTEDTTVSTTVDVSDKRGTVNWAVNVTDDVGLSDEVSRQVRLPDTLTVRNETAPQQIVNDSGTVSVRFIADDQVIERSTDDGEIDLSGLPVDQRMVVDPDVDGYESRQVIIDSIFEQQNIFLLPEGVDSVQPRFDVTDPTGRFGSESEVFIQLPIEFDGELIYRTVAADEAGSGGFTPVLAEDGRYTIRVRSQDGAERDLGPYEPVPNDFVELEPSAIEFDVTDDDGRYQFSTDFDDDEGVITFTWAPGEEYLDEGGRVTNLELEIYDRSGDLVRSERYGSVSSVRELLAEAPAGGSVEFEATFEDPDGEEITVSGSDTAGPGQMLVDFGEAPGLAITIMSVIVVLLVGALFSAANVAVGAIVTSLTAGGFYFVGALPSEVSGGLIGLAIFVSILNYVGRARQDAIPR